MAKFKEGGNKLATIPSLEWFLTHWRWGADWDTTTVLIDTHMNVIAFFDRGSANMEVMQIDTAWTLPFFLECSEGTGENVQLRKHTGVETLRVLNYDVELAKVMGELKVENVKFSKALERIIKKDIVEWINKENREYFSNIIKDGTQSFSKD